MKSFGLCGAFLFSAACAPEESDLAPPFNGEGAASGGAYIGGGGEGGALSPPEDSGGAGGASVPEPMADACGDGVWDSFEVCDPSAGEFESCQDLGFDGGATSCTAHCALDVSGCFSEMPMGRPQNVCGDGYRDELELCDDGNVELGDGCDAFCEVESSEHEPNDSPDEAETHPEGQPFYGLLETGEEDFLRFMVIQEPGTLTASLGDLMPGCAEETPGVNPALELLDSVGDPVAWDSDSGPGDCPLLVAAQLSQGVYYLRVVGEMSGQFPYSLLVTID